MSRAILLVLPLLFFTPLLASAQLSDESGAVEPLTVAISPAYPRPYQTITITPESTQINLAASTVTISAGSAILQTGSGSESANVTLGAPGTATVITVKAVTGGTTYTKQITVRPADAALVIEPSTTAHPFYGGGTPIASEGSLRLIAIPDIRTASGRVATENLVYTWKLGNRILEAQSGIGKSVLTATAPVRYRDTTVTLRVATQDGSAVAETSAVVAPIDPLVRIYRNDPLLGPLFNRALSGTLAMTGEEETYRGVPYFFAGAPTLAWSVNSAVNGAGRDITLRSTGSGGGTAALSLSARHAPTRQSAEGRVTIEFGKEGGFGIFGL